MKKVVASRPRPPFVDSTRGVKTSWAQPRALVHHTRLVRGGSWNDRRMRLDKKSLRQRMHPVTDSRSLSL